MIWALVVGLVIGAIAKLLMPGKDPGGIIVTLLLGVAGSYVASFIGQQTGNYEANEPAGIFASIVGAVILLAVYRMIIGKKRLTYR